MNGVWIPSLRAVMLFVIIIIALLAFAAAKITSVKDVASGEFPAWNVAENAFPGTAGFDFPIPVQQEVGMRQNVPLDIREQGAWLLIIFGLGAVASALRCRRSDRFRYQFA